MLWWLSSIRIPKSNGSQAIKRWLRSVRIFNVSGSIADKSIDDISAPPFLLLSIVLLLIVKVKSTA